MRISDWSSDVCSSDLAILTLPLGVLAAFVVMLFQGVNANIMSLGGIAIAIGAMVDAAVVMIENAHKKIERWEQDHPDKHLDGEMRWIVITEAAAEVGRSEEHTSELQSLMRISYAVFCLQKQKK